MTLGEKVKLKREELGLSQEELAEKMNYKSKTSIHKIEVGITDLPLSKVKELAAVLNTTPAYLMGWEDTMSVVEKKDLINKIEDKRINKNLSRNQIIEKVGIKQWFNEHSSESDILKVARYLEITTKKNQFILSFEAERNDLKNFYDWFMENTCNLNSEEIKRLKSTISNILKLINKGD